MSPRCLALALVLICFVPQAVGAHVVRFPRVLQVVVTGDRITVAISMTYHSGPQADRIRTRFDRDGSGRLDAEEQEAIAAWMDRRARAGLTLSLDGAVLDLQEVERKLTLTDNDRSEGAGGMELRSVSHLGISLRPGVRHLSIKDRPESSRALVPLRVDLPVHWELRDAVAQGEAVPPVRSGERSWQAAFAGEGGTLDIEVGVPARKEPAGSGDGLLGSAEPPVQ